MIFLYPIEFLFAFWAYLAGAQVAFAVVSLLSCGWPWRWQRPLFLWPATLLPGALLAALFAYALVLMALGYNFFAE